MKRLSLLPFGCLLPVYVFCWWNAFKSESWLSLFSSNGSSSDQDDASKWAPKTVIASTKIPHRMTFVDTRYNILQTREPKHLYDNIQNTIHAYSKAWNQSPDDAEANGTVMFFTDTECQQMIQQVEPRLLAPYKEIETSGKYKSDICRVVALYVHGGYYFDTDLQVIQVLPEPDPHIQFITATMRHMPEQFYNAIIAAPPKSPILRSAITSMVHDWYENPSILDSFHATNLTPALYRNSLFLYRVKMRIARRRKPIASKLMMGCVTLRIGYQQHEDTSSKAWVLEEFLNDDNPASYPTLFRSITKDGPLKKGCNYMVHDKETRTPYFYSRVPGTELCTFDE